MKSKTSLVTLGEKNSYIFAMLCLKYKNVNFYLRQIICQYLFEYHLDCVRNCQYPSNMTTLESQFFYVNLSKSSFYGNPDVRSIISQKESKKLYENLKKTFVGKYFEEEFLLYHFTQSFKYIHYLSGEEVLGKISLPRYGDFITHLQIDDPYQFCEKIILKFNEVRVGQFEKLHSSQTWELNIFRPPYCPCFLLNLPFVDVRLEFYLKKRMSKYDSPQIKFSAIYHVWSQQKRNDLMDSTFLSILDDERYLHYDAGVAVVL